MRAKHIDTGDIDIARFWVKVEKTETCWLWRGSLTAQGYGIYFRRGRNLLAHRVAYVLAHGNPDPELSLDHLCRVRNCVRPEHLDPCMLADNVRRSPVVNRGLGRHHRYDRTDPAEREYMRNYIRQWMANPETRARRNAKRNARLRAQRAAKRAAMT